MSLNQPYLLIALVIVAALLFLNQATRRRIFPDAAGRFHLRMNKLYSFGGVFGVLLGLGLSISGLMRESSLEMTGLVLIALGMTWSAGIPSLLYYYNHRVTFDDTSITVTNAFGETTTLVWEEITSAHFNKLSNLIILHAAGRKVKIHHHLTGVANLEDMLKEKKGWTLARTGRP